MFWNYQQVLTYLRWPAVAVFPGLAEAIATHRRLEQVFRFWFIQETLWVPWVQELLEVAQAAIAEELRDVVATVQKNKQTGTSKNLLT